MAKGILVIDQGTSSTRAMIFSPQADILAVAQRELPNHYPRAGWVEQDPHVIWSHTVELCREALEKSGVEISDIDSVGITNQRETTVIWDRKSGEPIAPAIVWLDRRTSKECEALHRDGVEATIIERSGLLLDPYFSASKVRWLLDNIDGARERAERGELAFGTVDSFLIYRLTGGKVHATDCTNAARTALFNVFEKQWDEELLKVFSVPSSLLPEVKPTSSHFGDTTKELFGRSLPITGVAGDQQSALVGQTCFQEGMAKCTFGTGSFLILNTGKEPIRSNNRLLTTIGYNLGGEVTYALEGSSFVAGATVQWLRDGLKLINTAHESEKHAQQVEDLGGVYLVPAFSGLGAPYWDADARAAIVGITRGTGVSDIVTAGLMSVAYQTRDLFEAMRTDGADKLTSLRVDGGMVVNNWLMQALADVIGIPIERPKINETTALGAAFLAGLHTGFYESKEQVTALWEQDAKFLPEMEESKREELYAGWQEAVERTRSTRK